MINNNNKYTSEFHNDKHISTMMTSSNGKICRVTGPFVRGIHRSPMNSSHKGQLRRALIFSSICAWINSRVFNRKAGDLIRHRTHYDVIVMSATITATAAKTIETIMTIKSK